MDRQTLSEVFDYTSFTWASYANVVHTLPPDAFTRPIYKSGWSDLRELLFHIAAGWDGWLRDRAGAEHPLDYRPEDVSSWANLDPIRERTRGWLRRVIDDTPDSELNVRTASVLEPVGGSTPASVADVLAHILLHERGHHGDVTTLLTQLGATVGNSDYLVYRWFAQRGEK